MSARRGGTAAAAADLERIYGSRKSREDRLEVTRSLFNFTFRSRSKSLKEEKVKMRMKTGTMATGDEKNKDEAENEEDGGGSVARKSRKREREVTEDKTKQKKSSASSLSSSKRKVKKVGVEKVEKKKSAGKSSSLKELIVKVARIQSRLEGQTNAATQPEAPPKKTKESEQAEDKEEEEEDATTDEIQVDLEELPDISEPEEEQEQFGVRVQVERRQEEEVFNEGQRPGAQNEVEEEDEAGNYTTFHISEDSSGYLGLQGVVGLYVSFTAAELEVCASIVSQENFRYSEVSDGVQFGAFHRTLCPSGGGDVAGKAGILRIAPRSVKPYDFSEEDMEIVIWVISGRVTLKSTAFYEQNGVKYLFGQEIKGGDTVVIPRRCAYTFENWEEGEGALLGFQSIIQRANENDN